MDKKRLETWWDGLSATERKGAVRSAASGKLDDSTRSSLQEAGLVDDGSSDDEIVTFLKSRH